MKKIMRYVGMDVHAESIAIAVVEQDGTERDVGTIPNRPEAIRKCLKKLGRAAASNASGWNTPSGILHAPTINAKGRTSARLITTCPQSSRRPHRARSTRLLSLARRTVA